MHQFIWFSDRNSSIIVYKCTNRMRYVPSPIPVQCSWVYSAMTNKSGRMQYHKIKPGVSKLRISRNEFIRTFNCSQIIAMRPLQVNGNETDFQMEFYV